MRKKAEPEQLDLNLMITEVKTEAVETPSAIISDEDIADFKAWKAAKAQPKVSVVENKDDKARAMWKEESRLVKGIFRCHEPSGGSVQFSFRKYKWDPTRKYTMRDGEVYEVPLSVARHLNQNCNYAVHSHILGADGRPTVDRGGKMRSRMNFESTEFSLV